MPYSTETTLNQCNRGKIYNCRKLMRIELDKKIVIRKRQYNKAKYCDCGFKVKIVELIDKEKHVEVCLIILYRCKEFYWFFGGREGENLVHNFYFLKSNGILEMP